MKETLALKKQISELRKEIDFLKKSSGILREGNRLMAYRFIQENCEEFGLRWLLNKLNINPNAYYNYLKNRKSQYLCKKDEIKSTITEIYHAHNGVDGYRTMQLVFKKATMSLQMVSENFVFNSNTSDSIYFIRINPFYFL